MGTPTEPDKTAVRSSAGLGTVDERLAFLREGKTEILFALLSRNFFMLAMDSRFRKTTPEHLFDPIVSALRERVPNESRSATARISPESP